jgi:hypothetical protein
LPAPIPSLLLAKPQYLVMLNDGAPVNTSLARIILDILVSGALPAPILRLCPPLDKHSISENPTGYVSQTPNMTTTQVQFISVNPGEVVKVEKLNRRRVRIQVMKDFRRKERERQGRFSLTCASDQTFSRTHIKTI